MKKGHFEILLEDINRKFDLVLEAHDALRQEIRETRDESNAKHDHTAFLIQTLSSKVDAVDAKVGAVAADLSAHRADTEAHHGMYRVKERPEEFGGGGDGEKS
jgi:adenine-specific DNA methylase